MDRSHSPPQVAGLPERRADRLVDRLSNLLSAADRFLGDQLRLQIVATNNAPLRSLEPAILRHGRLVGSRGFERLDRARALRLAETRGTGLPHQADYSVAEVFCAQPLVPLTSELPRPIGFRSAHAASAVS